MPNRPRFPAQSTGFTLVEVLVVMFIVGILVAVSMLSFGAVDQREFRGEADRLRLVLQHSADSALFQQHTLGLFVQDAKGKPADNNTAYWIGEYHRGKWRALTDKLFRQHTLSERVSLRVRKPRLSPPNNSNKQEEPPPSPVVLFYNGGEYTPFTMVLRQAERTPWVLRGDGLGNISVELADVW